MMYTLLEAARQYRDWGLSVVPVQKTKRPPGHWREFQTRLMTEEEMIAAFTDPVPFGIAIVCGDVSGPFEGLDIDSKYDLSKLLYGRFQSAIQEAFPNLFRRLVAGVTANKGYHFYYRCPEVGRSQPLAQRPATDDEKKAEPKHKVKVLIETRSNGGIIVVPPTPGYAFFQNDFSNLPVIQPAERENLLAIARSFNLYHKQKPPFAEIDNRKKGRWNRNKSSLLDFNHRGDIFGLLKSHGWIECGTEGPRTYFLRPGKTDHDTSGDYHHGLGLFKVFTTSSEFTPGEGYTPSAVFAALECGGDFYLAAKKLLALGFGIPRRYW